MKPAIIRALAIALLFALPARGHDIHVGRAVVIDTDMGLDDAVTLALALQSADVDLRALVACDGAAGPEAAARNLAAMVHRFNRSDVPVYAASGAAAQAAPPFRPFAEATLASVVPEDAPFAVTPFSPSAYASPGGGVTVLALGPLTNLAAALKSEPAMRDAIGHVVVAGAPDGWNMRRDPEALAAVRQSGLPLIFVVAGEHAKKPAEWKTPEAICRQRDSMAAELLGDLFGDAAVCEHYLRQFTQFHDELAFFYLVDHDIFSSEGFAGDDALEIRVPLNDAVVAHLFDRCVHRGRQCRARVVFSERPLPDSALQPDVRERRERILAAGGPDEWFAQLLMNELHDHLGAYSIIGVKMGLRAAELLNAPPHGMRVVAHTPPHPPVSCLNDGLIVATGATPGRGLFTHLPGAVPAVRATFTCNGRSVTLTLKAEYREKIKAKITALVDEHGLESAAYWTNVRVFGLDIWETWHRRDLFEVEFAREDQPRAGAVP